MNTTPRRRDQPADQHDLAEALPAPAHPVLTRDRHRVLREHLMAHITREQPGTTGTMGTTDTADTTPTTPVRPRPTRRLVLVAASLVLATAVALGAVAVDSAQDGKSASATADDRRDATRLLARIALAAADRPPVTVRDDQFIYTKSQGSARELGVDFTDPRELSERQEQGPFTVPEYKGAVRQEEWRSVDGKRDGLRTGVAVADPSLRMTMRMYGVGYLSFRQLQALPTDPDALLRRLYGDTGGVEPSRRAETALENIGAVIDSATLLPELSAALYRAMAQLPGARVVEHAEDAAGRKGVGLAFADSPKGYAWVFDASTLRYLGTTRSALLSVGVTDRTGQEPAPAS
ncbi:CU044_5270 family protein [Streptomyces sp. SID13726]|uniref:CU044_5270 family protein n=1 Tax=Streptomyces sp. SID13726 TaxID=2706058 RepID=UPI0013B5DE36|nr:CU044_5270 family protein [Streptomyces sp. SID13726]NEA98087.1 hypothetical protein [Streptomyces sp. SID13726]